MPGVFVPVADVAEFTLKAILAGQQINNIIHLKKSGGWDATSLPLALAALNTSWKNHILTKLSNDLVMQGIHAKDLTTSMGVESDSPWVGTAAGGVAVASAPGNVAFCVGQKTGLAGRSARGRTYLAGMPDTHVTDGQVPDSEKASFLAELDAIRTELAALGYIWGVVSKFSGYTQTAPKYKKVPTPRVAGLFNAITTLVADRITDSQRRRLPGRGV